MKYIDAHTHAHFAVFKDDYKHVIGRAIDSGVSVVNVGTQRDTSKRAVEVAHELGEGVWAVVGLHPIHTEKSFHDEQELGSVDPITISNSRELENKEGGDSRGFTSRGEEFDYEYYKKLALDSKVVAIGECGLDYFRIMNNESGIMNVEEVKKRQKDAFIKQIELAKEVQKPLMIHCRDAFDDLVAILDLHFTLHNSKAPGIVHFFTGTKENAKVLLGMDFYFTFGGVVTFTRDYDEIIKLIPMDRILSETDAPYVTPVPFRGKRNEPAYVIYVVRKLAEIKGVTEEEMTEQIWSNAKRVFGI
ncbi:MAG: TatD family hydrolase [Patescibacteria group bacterium]